MRIRQRLGIAVLLLAAGALPAFASDFQIFRLSGILIFAIALLGLNILTGYNGQISLGHGAFYTLGAYAAAALTAYFKIPHWLALPIAAGVCLAAGCLFALPLVRLPPMQFALVTFALAMTTPTLANYKSIERWTGGSRGMGLDKPEVPFGLPLSYDQWIYLLALTVLAVLFVAASNLLKGRIGRAAVAIRDDALAAQVAGIDTTYYKSLIFGISAMYVGIAGALSAMALLYVSPAGIFVSLGFLIASAIGGIASLSGAIYGAAILQIIMLLTGAIAHSAKVPAVLAIYGVIVIAFLHVLPAGVAGGVANFLDWARRRLRAGSPERT